MYINKYNVTEFHVDILLFNYGSSLNIFFLNSGLKTRLMSQVADFITLPKGSIFYSYSVWYSSKPPGIKRTNKI